MIFRLSSEMVDKILIVKANLATLELGPSVDREDDENFNEILENEINESENIETI
jgi:hypothetical protein